MLRPLRDLRILKSKLKVPIIYAGDIFDHWKSLPELINFAMEALPPGYAVPGQHDLPNHSYEDIERSAYWTLVEGGVLVNLEPGKSYEVGNLELFGFPWGHQLTKCPYRSNFVTIAVVHEYCWHGKHKYLTAPPSNHVSQFETAGYDAAVFGDNHQGFINGRICNTGGFMRRHKPDLDRHPFVGVLMNTLDIKEHRLDTANDIYSLDSEDRTQETGSIDISKFTDGLKQLPSDGHLDFPTLVDRYCRENEVSSVVRNVIHNAIQEES